jgi:RNA polymerase sigma-70 factor (ECF subfamily)
MADKSTMTASPLALEDEMLVRRIQDGDTGAFGRLVLKYQDRVVNVCWRMCGNLEDAQDVAQDAFVHAFEKIGAYRFEASFYTWLFRIAVNQALSHRRKSRRVVLSLHDSEERVGSDGQMGRSPRRETSDMEEPSARLSADEMHDRLVKSLDRLEDDARAVIVLRDMEALDYREIADVLAISVGTVKSRLHRARLALRDMVLRNDRGAVSGDDAFVRGRDKGASDSNEGGFRLGQSA